MTTVDEREALVAFRAGFLAFAEEPSPANLRRYLVVSRRLDAARGKTSTQAQTA